MGVWGLCVCARGEEFVDTKWQITMHLLKSLHLKADGWC